MVLRTQIPCGPEEWVYEKPGKTLEDVEELSFNPPLVDVCKSIIQTTLQCLKMVGLHDEGLEGPS